MLAAVGVEVGGVAGEKVGDEVFADGADGLQSLDVVEHVGPHHSSVDEGGILGAFAGVCGGGGLGCNELELHRRSGSVIPNGVQCAAPRKFIAKPASPASHLAVLELC